MASFYHVGHAYTNSMSGHHNNHHHGRSRRGQRMSSSQNTHRQHHMVRTQKSPKQSQENPAFNAYIKDLEAAKGFDFEDDEAFCPFHLLTEDDLQSIHSSAASDRSSLSSASPDASPLQQQAQPTPSFVLSGPNGYTHNAFQHRPAQHQQHAMKLHQPMAQRSRNAIPIVDPSTRSVASPPPSVSPARQMQHQYGRRW
ncbi:hypothetical protein ANO11243_031250 [Dothideomycetidae sp. 11243]|nr:hypothetical protein ANO11243_031250 [fungal sp. No.11243]